MGQVTITLNSRTYRLRCGDGEERRLLQLADHLKRRIDGLAAEFGQVGDDRLLVMAALLVTDELLDALDRLGGADGAGALVPQEPALTEAASVEPPGPADPVLPPELPGSVAATATTVEAKPTLKRPVARPSLNERLADARETGPIERKTG